LGIVSVVENEEPFVFLVPEPSNAVLGCVSSIGLSSDALERGAQGFLTAGCDKEDLRKSGGTLSLATVAAGRWV
jgi:hypothetical protein